MRFICLGVHELFEVTLCGRMVRVDGQGPMKGLHRFRIPARGSKSHPHLTVQFRVVCDHGHRLLKTRDRLAHATGSQEQGAEIRQCRGKMRFQGNCFLIAFDCPFRVPCGSQRLAEVKTELGGISFKLYRFFVAFDRGAKGSGFLQRDAEQVVDPRRPGRYPSRCTGTGPLLRSNFPSRGVYHQTPHECSDRLETARLLSGCTSNPHPFGRG